MKKITCHMCKGTGLCHACHGTGDKNGRPCVCKHKSGLCTFCGGSGKVLHK